MIVATWNGSAVRKSSRSEERLSSHHREITRGKSTAGILQIILVDLVLLVDVVLMDVEVLVLSIRDANPGPRKLP